VSVNASIVANVLRREGSTFVVEAATCSKFGITLETLQQWRGQAVTPSDVKALTRDEAAAIYHGWLDSTRIGEIGDAFLRETVFDGAVNSGPGRAIRWLQRALGVEDDGVIGEKTLDAVARADADAVRAEVVRRRIIYLGEIITDRPARYAPNAHGWMTRVAEFVR
jgi:lysozyme family protein